MWTVVPPELVWEGVEKEPARLQEITWRGAKVLVEPITFAQAKIVQVLSSEPNDYLRSDLEPGTIVELLP